MSGKSLRTAAGIGAAVVLGTLMARGLPHHAAAPPPPSSSGSGGSRFGYDVLALIVLAAVGTLALALYHRRKMRALHMAQARLDGFVNVSRADLGDLWRCTDCHGLILLADIDDHQDDSCCSRDRARQEQDGADDAAEPPSWSAEIAPAAATVPPEHSVTGGDVDTFREIG